MTERTDVVYVTTNFSIPYIELDIRATTGGGPGGQHVNRSATRIELWWRPGESKSLSASLSPDHLQRVLSRLHQRLDSEGRLRLVASEHRSQRRNREAAALRLAAIVRSAIPDPSVRKKTKPSRAAQEKRLDEKRRQSDRKRERRRPHPND